MKINSCDTLGNQITYYNLSKVCDDIHDDKRFLFGSGSSQPYQHHYGAGGLMKHTVEVINLASLCRLNFPEEYLDGKELFLACFFHDVGKMYDYKAVTSTNHGENLSTDHKRNIHHISRSAIIWSEQARKDEAVYDQYFEKVLHAILSHHMSRAAGSPVAPKSRVAWMLTLCDNMSARMDDADTFDVLDRRK